MGFTSYRTRRRTARLALFTASFLFAGTGIAPLAFAETFTGTEGDDTIIGTNEDDEIFSGAGSDTVKARAGNDYIEDFEAGDDVSSHNVLKGGRGDDEILAINANNEVYGDTGNDNLTIVSDAGDVAYGGNGNDLISVSGDNALHAYGGAGDDEITVVWGNGCGTVEGGSGDDEITGRPDCIEAYGGRGNDFIEIEFGNQRVMDGGADHDTIIGGDAHEVIGGSGDDNIAVFSGEIFAGRGDDTLTNRGGNVNMTGNAGADTFECGDGYDIVQDFSEEEGDIIEGDCEEVRSEG